MKRIIKLFVLILIFGLMIGCQDNVETLKNQSFEEIEDIIGETVNSNILLLDEINGFGVRYEISHPEIINEKGKVTLPVFDTDVTITIILDVQGVDVRKEFVVKVQAIDSDSYKNEIKDYLYNNLGVICNLFEDAEIKNSIINKFNAFHSDLEAYNNNQDLTNFFNKCKDIIEDLPEVTNAIITKLNDLDVLFNTFDKTNYSDENYQLLISAYNNGKANLLKQNTISDVNGLYDEILKELSLVPVETLDDEKEEYINKMVSNLDNYISNKYITLDQAKDKLEEYKEKINNAETFEEIVKLVDDFDNELVSIKKVEFNVNLEDVYAIYKEKINSIDNLSKLDNIYKTYKSLVELTSSFQDIINLSNNLSAELSALESNELEFKQYKETSISTIENIYNGFDSLLYSLENYNNITLIYNEYKDKVELSNNKNEIANLLKEYQTKINEVPTDIKDTLNDLNDYYKLLQINDYTEDNKKLLDSTYEEYANKIKAAKTTEEVNLLYSEAISKLGDIEVVDNELIAYKVEIISVLNSYFETIYKEEYTEENYALVLEIYNKCISDVESANSKEEIDNFVSEAKSKIDNIEKLDLEFENYKKNALNELTNYYNSIDKNSYSEANYTIITTLYNDCYQTIINSGDKETIEGLINGYKVEVEHIEKEKTAIEKLFEIEEDIAYILDLSGKTINKDIVLKVFSLYDSKITWKSSNEEVLSTTGVVGENILKTKVSLSYQVLLDGITYEGIEIVIYVDTATVLPEYYNTIDLSLTGTQLKKQLRTLITKTHTTILSYGDLRQKNPITDVDPDNSNNLILFYMRTSVPSAWDGGSTWNREHVWPKSLSWFDTSGAGADIHHLRPTNPTANSTRNNFPYGEVSNREYHAKKVGSVVYGYLNGGYFEPLDEVKGDAARIILYLLVRYAESDSYSVTRVFQSMDVLLKWHTNDPVDDFERTRNEKSYEIQGNRNPFIDYPEFANMIYSSSISLSNEEECNVNNNYVITFNFFGKEYQEVL